MTHQQDDELDIAMKHVIRDTEHFLEDLKGQKQIKGLVKKDVQHLKEHLHKLMERVAHLEIEHTE